MKKNIFNTIYAQIIYVGIVIFIFILPMIMVAYLWTWDSDTEYEIGNIANARFNININLKNIIISIILIIIFIFIRMMLSKKRTKDIKRDTQGLVSPIIAEYMIDRKIGFKELIMTTIVDLSLRGNLEIINDDTVKMINKIGLKDYESQIVDIIFRENNYIKFEDINKIFIYYNDKVRIFKEDFKRIKKEILNYLYREDLLSKSGKKLLKITRVFLKIFLIFIIIAISGVGLEEINEIFGICFLIAIALFVPKGFGMGFIVRVILMYVAGLIIFIGTIDIFKNPILIFHVIELIIVNIINIFNIVFCVILIKLCKKEVFSKKGKEEIEKLQKLKNYLKNYTLIKERNLESYIIWDDYLSYAIAFGIPNRVMKKINEGTYKINLKLQIIYRAFIEEIEINPFK